MKKLTAVILSLILALSCFVLSASAKERDNTIAFNEDGTFKIMMMNDLQDVGVGANGKTTAFMEKVLDAEKPDLVVLVGDQLSDVYPFANAKDYRLALDTLIAPLAARNIPFLATLGNHDHDRESALDAAGQYEIYKSYANFAGTENGPDSFTYSVPVYDSTGENQILNIYIHDSNNKAPEGGYSGITADQLEWYNETSAELKAANGGEPMPSLLFQHVPVKEIYSLLTTDTRYCDDDNIYSRRDGKWYRLDETKAEGTLGEAPCSENFDHITGQYQAWLVNGDIIGAYFAHDHLNNFVGVTDDGIRMGYNGGTGFRSYGDAGDRSVRIFEFDESDVTAYTTRIVTYNDVMEDDINFYINDLFSPALLNVLMKFVYMLFGMFIKQ